MFLGYVVTWCNYRIGVIRFNSHLALSNGFFALSVQLVSFRLLQMTLLSRVKLSKVSCNYAVYNLSTTTVISEFEK